MKFDIDKKNLLKLLERCVSAIDTKSPMPILQNVLVSATGTTVHLESQSLTQTVSGDVTADVAKSGSCLVEGRKLLDRIKSMLDGDIRLSLDSDVLTIRGTSHSRKFSIQTMPADDWPRRAQPDDSADPIRLSSTILATLIDATILAVSQDDTRVALSSLLVEFEPKALRCVSTDGHRLNMSEATCAVDVKKSILIPHRAAQMVKSIVSGNEREIELRTNGSWGFIDSESVRIGFRLCDSQFPPWEQVLPKQGKIKAVVNRAGLMSSVKALISVTNDTKGLKLHSEGDLLTISGGSPDSGDGEDSVSATTKGKATVGIHPKYLVDALTSLPGEKVVLYLGGERDPILIVPEDPSDGFDFNAVVMPMRL